MSAIFCEFGAKSLGNGGNFSKMGMGIQTFLEKTNF
jgi:hypothetical protein